jgi:hypothetical protein
MHVASGVDIGSPAVQGRVNHEPGCVDWLVGAADPVAVFVDVDHVRHLQDAKVHAVGVDPECVWLDWICFSINIKSTRSSGRRSAHP